MKWILGAVVLASILVPDPASAAPQSPSPAEAALTLTIVRGRETTEVSCVLINREDRQSEVVLYFVTAAQPFRMDDGRLRPYPTAVTLNLDGTTRVAVNPADISLSNSLTDIALFPVTVPATAVLPRSITFDDPKVGAMFLIAGRTASRQPLIVPQHVSRRATAVLVGDRDVSGLAPCTGAPALSEAGVFGIVTTCGPGLRPVVSLFSFAQPWMVRRVPNLSGPTVLTKFEVAPQQFSAPLIVDSCKVDGPQEADLPLTLRSDEVALDATARLANRTSFRIGELTVVKLANELVKLRFTLTPPPKALLPKPEPCQRGEVFVNVRVNVLKVPR